MIDETQTPVLETRLPRRAFLQRALVAGGAMAFVAASCKKDDDDDVNPDPDPNAATDLGTGDIGILNYAYALEQLEAAFYTQVVANASFTSIFNQREQDYLKQIRDHEIIHREFFQKAIGTAAIKDLTPNFSSINFANRDNVLQSARTFEDLGVKAYNGAGKLLVDVQYLVLAGKIVSVEARHASAIRYLISPDTAAFAGDDVVDPATGLDGAVAPAQVITSANNFLTTKISGNNLPK